MVPIFSAIIILIMLSASNLSGSELRWMNLKKTSSWGILQGELCHNSWYQDHFGYNDNKLCGAFWMEWSQSQESCKWEYFLFFFFQMAVGVIVLSIIWGGYPLAIATQWNYSLLKNMWYADILRWKMAWKKIKSCILVSTF